MSETARHGPCTGGDGQASATAPSLAADADAEALPAPGQFVIFCAGRAGSTLLCEYLDSHPDILCHQELYNPFAVCGARDLGGADTRSRDADPLGFLAQVYRDAQARAEVRQVGFKHLFVYEPQVTRAVLGDPLQRIILLRRRDKVAQWGSYRLALASGRWRQARDAHDDSDAARQVRFRVASFFAYLVHQHCRERMILDRRPDCLEIWYEDVVDGDGLARVLRFLGVSADVEVSASVVRQFNGRSTWDRFTNPLWARLGSRIARALAHAVIKAGLAPAIRSRTRC